MQDFSKLWRQAFLSTYESLFEVGRIGQHESDDSYTVLVPNRSNRVYVTLGAARPTGVVEAINLHAPRKAGIPVKLLKLSHVYIIWGVDESSPAFVDGMYNVVYHHHGAGTGLEAPAGESNPSSFLGLTDTPSFYSGAGGRVVAVSTSENKLEYIVIPVTSVNGKTGAVTLTTDDIAEGIVADRNYITDAEEIKLAGIETAADVTDMANVAAAIDVSTENTALADTDRFAQTVAGVLKWMNGANLKATLKTYFDTLYTVINTAVMLTGAQTKAGALTLTDGLVTGTVTAPAASSLFLQANGAVFGARVLAAGGFTPFSTSVRPMVIYESVTVENNSFQLQMTRAAGTTVVRGLGFRVTLMGRVATVFTYGMCDVIVQGRNNQTIQYVVLNNNGMTVTVVTQTTTDLTLKFDCGAVTWNEVNMSAVAFTPIPGTWTFTGSQVA